MLIFNTAVDGIQMGLCFAILAMGVYISYSILDFPDLSVDGTFPLGGIVSTVLMLKLGMDPTLAVLLSFFVGFAVGALTGFLHVRLHIANLLSGIIVMTGLLSVTLALTTLLTKNGHTTTIFSYRSENIKGIFGSDFISGLGNKDLATIIVLLLLVIFIKIIIDLFMKTKVGYLLKATGDNEKLVVSLGKNPGAYKILGLALANGFVAISGGVYSNLYMSYDNTCGSGKVVLALASVIIGTAVFSKIKFIKPTTSVILGAIVYSFCLNFLALVDENGIYLKLMNAVMFAVILVINTKFKALNKGTNYIKSSVEEKK